MLETIPLEPDWDPPSDDAARLIERATTLEDRYLMDHAKAPESNYHSSNFAMLHHAFAEIVAQKLASGAGRLLEWGSGMGVAASLWAMRGGESWGIESEAELVELSNSLAQTFQLNARFVLGNFVPPEAWERVDALDDTSQMVRSGPVGYSQMPYSIDDFDIVFVYPWPGERRLMQDIFDFTARPGALLLMFLGADELLLQRKQS